MFMISGTIKESVKLAQMNQEWLEKKEKGIFKKEKEMTPQERQLEMFKEQAEQNRESAAYANIAAKIESGGTLTLEEIEYLRAKNPEALRRYEEIKAEKKSFERQLRNCKTKDEVERLKIQKIGGYLAAAKKISNNPSIPKGQKLALLQNIVAKVTNINEAHMKFVKSTQYQELPTDEELAEEKRERVEELTGTEEATVADKENNVDEMTEDMAVESDSLIESCLQAEGAVTVSDKGAEEIEVQQADFDTALQTIQNSINKLQSDTYDRSGDGAQFESDRELGKRIDLKR
ncbi:MAG: hypothetical protein IJ379_15165 [Lachnospiraceae bacterium]|nr:hypothetical protein [Lachnospiraceae bacterium]MBQ7777257.1 hypothetical protein [Lachnospiraceae bacterium]